MAGCKNERTFILLVPKSKVLPCGRYFSTMHKFQSLRNLEGKTVCKLADGNQDATCAAACCPANTCDTAPSCAVDSATGEKMFDGISGPLAMKSRYVCRCTQVRADR